MIAEVSFSVALGPAAACVGWNIPRSWHAVIPRCEGDSRWSHVAGTVSWLGVEIWAQWRKV